MKRVGKSKPTLCLGCHITVIMTRGPTAWDCPVCSRQYPFIWWKIKPAEGKKKRVEVTNS